MSHSILVAIPVFNDWESLKVLIQQIDFHLCDQPVLADVLVLNDGSTVSYQESLSGVRLESIKNVYLLDLKRNVGHQRAISIGLCYIEEEMDYDAVILMDGDGEDDPADIPRLIRKCWEYNNAKIIFAQRSQRSETVFFRLFYKLYKFAFRMLTGADMAFGNFSIIPQSILSRTVVVSEIWNHYAAGILKAKIPFSTLPCKRSNRIAGRSKMNFVSLVMHGLSAISVYGDIIGVKAVILTIALMLCSIILTLIVMLVRVAIPDWAPYVAGLSFIIFLQCLTASLAFIFLVLNGRNSFNFLPKRDYKYFISSIYRLPLAVVRSL